jgi:RimJ/RimL family protein N-acetyltransferase
MEEIKAAYPSQYETESLLRDGSSLPLRPIRKDDAQQWLDFVHELGPDIQYLWLHHISKEMGLEDAVRFCTVDYHDTFAFVAETLGEPERDIVAAGKYYRLPNHHSAEVVFATRDDYQGRGLSTAILQHLVGVARENGIDTFEADVIVGNERMINVFKDYGFHITSEVRAGVYHITFPIARTPAVEQKEADREQASMLELRFARYLNPVQ